MNPGKVFSLQVSMTANQISKKDLVYHGKELSSLKKAIYSFNVDVIAILKRRAR